MKSIPPAEGDVNLSPNRIGWMRNNVSECTGKGMDRDARHFIRQSLSTPCLNVLTVVEGAELVDLEGRRFLDFHGNSVHQVGFGNPLVVEAIKLQLDALSFCPRRYTNLPAVELAERLRPTGSGQAKHLNQQPKV
jgi:4-aminobutyrate aminotransferase